MNLEQCFKSSKRNKFNKKHFTIASPKKLDQEEYDFKIKMERGEESDSSPRLKKNSNQEFFDV